MRLGREGGGVNGSQAPGGRQDPVRAQRFLLYILILPKMGSSAWLGRTISDVKGADRKIIPRMLRQPFLPVYEESFPPYVMVVG